MSKFKSIDEAKEALLDEALLAELDIEPYQKVSTSLLFVIHRQLVTLSKLTDTAVEKMDREFILENLTKVNVSDQAMAKARASVKRKLASKQLKA